MATLGAELGCGRHLASTVVTGSGQRSSTFLAELCLSTVLVLALRAFHCRPRRKKRARCPARVTSRMVDASRFSCGGQDRHRRLLCPRCQRPPRRRAAEKRDELPPFHVEHGGLPRCQPADRPVRSVFRHLSLPQRGRLVLGANLNCSESRRWPALSMCLQPEQDSTWRAARRPWGRAVVPLAPAIGYGIAVP